MTRFLDKIEIEVPAYIKCLIDTTLDVIKDIYLPNIFQRLFVFTINRAVFRSTNIVRFGSFFV